MWRVAIDTQGGPNIGRPELLFDDISLASQRLGIDANYAVAPDGRFVMIQSSQTIERIPLSGGWP